MHKLIWDLGFWILNLGGMYSMENLTKGTESFRNCAFFRIVNFRKNLQKVRNESFFRKFRKFTIRKNAQFRNDSIPFVRISVHFLEKIFYRGICHEKELHILL